MNPTVIVLSVVALIVWTRHIQKAVSAVAGLLNDSIQSLEKPLESAMQEFSGWLRRDGVPGALSLLLNDSVAGLVSIASVADYKVLQKSLALIWPWTESSSALAGATVAMVGLLGYAAHSAKGMIARTTFGLMLALLIGFQATLAYIRAAEVEKVQNAPVVAQVPPQGQLLIGGASPASAANSAASDGPSAESTSAGVDLLAILSAMVAVLLSLAQAYGCSRMVSGPGGTALAWTVFFPLLALNAGVLSVVRFLRRSNAAMALASVLDACLEAVAQVQIFLLQLVHCLPQLLVKAARKVAQLLLRAVQALRKLCAGLATLLRPSAIRAWRQRQRAARAQVEIDELRLQTTLEAVRRISIYYIACLSRALDANPIAPQQSGEASRAVQNAIGEYRSIMAEFGRDIPAPPPIQNAAQATSNAN